MQAGGKHIERIENCAKFDYEIHFADSDQGRSLLELERKGRTKMVEARYFRDYRHSYMILQCRQTESDRSYQFKILTSDKIKEILKCSLRYVNGMTYLYYDISSRTNLESMYRGRKMTYEQVKDLIEQLYGIYSKLGTYFMEESKLVLLPEHIYYDLSRQKYIGLYYPDYESELANPYEPLMDYLLEHIDGRDEEFADCMYRVYEMSEEANFSLEDALQIFGSRNKKEAVIVRPEVFSAVKEKPIVSQTEENLTDLFVHSKESEAPVQKKRSPFYPILSAFSLFGIVGAMGIYYLYELSQEEILVLLGCVGLMGLCLVISLAGSFKKHGGRNRNQEMKEIQTEGWPVEYQSEPEMVPLEQVLSKDMDLAMTFPVGRPKEGFPGEGFSETEEECSNTVFFDSARMAEHKLYALDRRNKQHIELTKFPYTVGKMAGCVDCVLEDDSISRIHARFEKEGESIRMTDMNSTNGTYKNGLRMQPQETVEIEPGDEIRFGKLNYCYR